MKEMRKLRVGLLRAPRIEYMVDDVPYTVEAQDIAQSSRLVKAGADGTITICNVVIGIGFHWQRTEDQTFMGDMEFALEEGEVRATNIIDIEDYLLSVISSEMSAKATEEFLKAHAVISRSWVVARIIAQASEAANTGFNEINAQGERTIIRWYGTEAHHGFDVCADDHCQRYQGISRARENAENWEKVKRVIAATRGEVLTYDGAVCDARFSKCCGGTMERFSACWEDVDYPYLQVKADSIGDSGTFCDTSDPAILNQVMNNYDLETRDFFRWRVQYRPAELSALVARKSGIDFGLIHQLTPLERGGSGRITRLRIVGEKCTIVVGKELEIRRWLSDSHLYSSAFDIKREGELFVLDGRGWGHGVGLCQIGAAAMGARGYRYTEILQHYYPNSSLSQIREVLERK